ncbi:T9SS type A sorting domain-containing protein [Flavilitoribacter nigricans]|uniref:HYR domain-containing protein n=1 Tax=Flavilitoribacter nigricans (strain ATCC 23147 / DSM 23189 / NBRC 102662 / NCIMB 1420 / SS-2) TaxID=1122177 RepID=A0A2D0NAD6_FLAN2|nr:T9SS type A sorting domain-containing protein [Flavilitoribacter nigricans]PHN05474.1 hypothetical protein CRP01_15885 [Flavilitoribacter nigricans DSM 23189 = NBRC 102662]
MKPLNRIILLLLLGCCLSGGVLVPVQAQKLLQADEQTYEFTYDQDEKVRDFIIPDLNTSDGYAQIDFFLLGGDGGRRRISGICTEPGGNGARVNASFQIGRDSGQLAPGGTVRFIVGQQGGSLRSSGLSGAGGGGGTAILYRPPGVDGDGESCTLQKVKLSSGTYEYVAHPGRKWSDDCWNLLAVAGGGGGPYAPGGCAESSSGKPGNASEDGSDGKGVGSTGGTDGYWGEADIGGDGAGYWNRVNLLSNANGQAGLMGIGAGGVTNTLNVRGGDGYGGGGSGTRGVYLVAGGGGGGYSGGGGGGNYNGGGGGGSFVNPYAFYELKRDGNGTDRTPNNGKITYRFGLDPAAVGAPVARCQDVTILISGDPVALRPSDADDGSTDPNNEPLQYRLREAGIAEWNNGTIFDCSHIGDVYTYSLQVDNGIHASECEFSVEIEQGPSGTLACPASIIVQPEDCLPIIGEYLIYYYEGEAYFPDFEPQSYPACNTQIENYIIRPDGSIDTTQITPTNEPLGRDTFDFGISTVVYTATFEDENAVEQIQSCAFTITVEAATLAPRCPTIPPVQYPDGCGKEVSGLLPDYECGELAYRITGPELENPTITEGTGELNSFFFQSGTSTVEWWLADIGESEAKCSYTVYVEESFFMDRPTFTNCPGTTYPEIYEYISPEAILAQIDFAATDDCGVAYYELKANGGSAPVLRCDDIGNSKRMEIWAYDHSGEYTVCDFFVVAQDADRVACPDDVTVEVDNQCDAMVNVPAASLAPLWTGCNVSHRYTLLDGNGVLLANGDGDMAGQPLGRGEYLASYWWIENSGVTKNCSFTVKVKGTQAPVAVCQNLAVQLSDVPEDLAAQVGAGSTDDCDSQLDYDLALELDCAQPGLNTAYLTVTDQDGNSSECVTVINVIDDLPPIITSCPPDRTVDLLADTCAVRIPDLTGEITGTLECGDFAIVQFPEADSLIGAAHGDVLEVLVSLFRDNGVQPVTPCTVSLSVADTDAPVAQCTAPNDVVVQLSAIPENLAETIAAGSTDNCGIVSYSLERTTFDCTDVGDRPVTVTVTDAAGNSDQCSTYISVNDDIPPTSACYETLIVKLNSSGTATLTAKDLDNGSSDNCSTAENLNYYLLDANDTPLSGTQTFDCDDIGQFALQLQVEDEFNNTSASCTTLVTVVDVELPQINCVASHTASLDENGQLTLSATGLITAVDNCTPTEALQLLLVRELADGTFEYAPTLSFDCEDVGTQLIGAFALDAYENAPIPCEINLTVEDNTAPTAVCQDLIVQLGANGQANLTAAEVDKGSADLCGPVSLYLDRTFFDCDDIGTVQANLFVTDANNNRSSCQTNLQVFDVTGPQIDCYVDYTVSLGANGQAIVLPEDVIFNATDNCTPYLGIQFKLVVDNGAGGFTTVDSLELDCNDLGNQLVGGFVVDAHSNTSSTCEVNLTVYDRDGFCTDCESTLTLTGDMAEGTYRAADWIESDGTVQTGTVVHFRAGNSIRLVPGFHAEAGSDFTARIEDCETAPAEIAAASDPSTTLKEAQPLTATANVQFGVFPNPFTQQFTLQYEVVEATETEVRMISMDGKMRLQLLLPQLQSSGRQRLEWDGSKLVAGIYIVQLRLGDVWYSRKVIKMK